MLVREHTFFSIERMKVNAKEETATVLVVSVYVSVVVFDVDVLFNIDILNLMLTCWSRRVIETLAEVEVERPIQLH